MGTVTALRKPLPEPAESYQTLDVPGTDQKISVEVNLIPADQMPQELRSSTNVAQVTIGGKEFFAQVAKTGLDPYG